MVTISIRKLPMLCFHYGRMGHLLRECLIQRELGEKVKEDKLPFGSFMRIGNKVQRQRKEGRKGQRVEPK